ncbi:DUF4837 family protein [Allomuricauda sp. SCSIO 65647]|uniref:DUF4837 family protein n=1 Tax=Allomuricauda sp. SCSIO 65647 TaxID=2908843 RepID=UPI001F394E72|nr:DUF4837 family protein [Muricauda sp. SCSIO 65647]UJH69054.1 DUF4837 family protein [Muricauda sp. SCSIO 65647]
MKKFLGTLFLTGLLLAGISCNDNSKKQKFLPPSTGSVNSLMVVMNTDLWQGEVGDRIREHFAATVVGLPWEEPLFTITQLPPKVFRGAALESRSILYVLRDSAAMAYVSNDVYAKPQRVTVVKGPNNEELLQGLDSIAQKAMMAYRDVEISEAQKRFTRSLNKEKALEEQFGIKLTIPSVYRVGKEEDKFVWLDRQIQKGTMNIIAYEMPMSSLTNDSTFVQDIVRMRDSIGEKYIPGPNKGTYMITEKVFAPYVFPAEVAGKKAVEVRGIWEIHGYPMAGPFLTYIINDKKNDRRLVLEGFTFAPATEKRDYMFELEAILKTLAVP